MRASWVVQGHGDSLVGLGTEDGFLRGHNGTSPLPLPIPPPSSSENMGEVSNTNTLWDIKIGGT